MKKTVFFFFAIIGIAILTYLLFLGQNDAQQVPKIPSGFVHLQSNLRNGLNYMPFEKQISFLDADGVGIFSTGLKSSDFIVKFDGEYYVNEQKLLELIDIAAISPEQRDKTYCLGDEVTIHGAGQTAYTVKIISIKSSASAPYYSDSLTTYTIKYTATSNISDNNNKNVSFFSFVETEGGVTYSSFEIVDEETINVRIRARENDKIEAIILKSPEYPGLSYRIVVD